MAYTSLFNMLLYGGWEDRLTELLRWLIARSPALASQIAHRAGLTGTVGTVDVRARSAVVGQGAPDAVLVFTMADGSDAVVAVEVKLGAATTGYQQKEYNAWLDARPEAQRGFLLMGPLRRTDLAAAHPRFLSLDDAFALVADEGGQIPLGELVRDARSWFVDPEVDAEEVKTALSTDAIPYWPLKEVLSTLQARIDAEAGAALVPGNIVANRDPVRRYYGFTIDRRGTTIAWCGFYIYRGEAGFYVNLDRSAVRASEDDRLHVLPDGGFPLRPWYWQPAATPDGPWSASALWKDGLADLVRELCR